MSQPTSRQKVLDYIQAQRSVTAGEVSRSLRMTPANARHHLAILEEQGLVQVVGSLPSVRRGRPELVYSLSHQAQGDTLVDLSEALLDSLPEASLSSLAARLAGISAADRPRHLTLRLAALAQRLNELHYQARWEAHASGPAVILGSCPYAAIIERHPELCQMDAALLEQFLGAPVEQQAKLAKDRRGGCYCLFRVKS